jgi:hypothetical protein
MHESGISQASNKGPLHYQLVASDDVAADDQKLRQAHGSTNVEHTVENARVLWHPKPWSEHKIKEETTNLLNTRAGETGAARRLEPSTWRSNSLPLMPYGLTHQQKQRKTFRIQERYEWKRTMMSSRPVRSVMDFCGCACEQ